MTLTPAAKPPAKPSKAETSSKPAKPAKPAADITSTGRDRATQHIDAKRLGRYR